MNLLFDAFQSPETRWIPAFLAASIAGLVAFRFGALTSSGMIAAAIVGGSIVAMAGWWPGIVLVCFFVSSSALSLLGARTGEQDVQTRGKRRDAVQVLANGGVPAFCSVVSALVNPTGPWLVASIAAIAAATSDTWGTEIGRLSRTTPRMVTSWKTVAPGTSGAVTPFGTLGSFGGALLIGLVAVLGTRLTWMETGLSATELVAIVTVAGFAGSLIDSLLGATVQARYQCAVCGVETERLIHVCGSRTVLRKGRAWLDNDAVNLLAIATAAAMGIAAASIWS